MIKFAIVGCGRIAQRHAEILGNNLIKHSKLVAVCDKVFSKAKTLGEKFNVKYYKSMTEMMNKSEIDVVAVLTESGLHSEHVIELTKYCKNIIVEKPMALTLIDADKMISECDRMGTKLYVVKQNRFNLPIVKLRKAIDENRFGKLVLGTVRVRWKRDQAYYDQDKWRGTWAYDGGVLTNQASHHIDMLEWMMGDVQSVFAMTNTALLNIETEDTGVVVLKFGNGALGVIEATNATRPNDLEGSISILGEKGTVVIGGFAMNKIQTWDFVNKTEDDSLPLESYNQNPKNVYGFGHIGFYENVVDSIQTGNKQLIDGLEGRKSLELISAIYQSVETKREVPIRFNQTKSKLGIR